MGAQLRPNQPSGNLHHGQKKSGGGIFHEKKSCNTACIGIASHRHGAPRRIRARLTRPRSRRNDLVRAGARSPTTRFGARCIIPPPNAVHGCREKNEDSAAPPRIHSITHKIVIDLRGGEPLPNKRDDAERGKRKKLSRKDSCPLRRQSHRTQNVLEMAPKTVPKFFLSNTMKGSL